MDHTKDSRKKQGEKNFFEKFSILLPFLYFLVGYQLRGYEILLTVISKI